MRTSENEVEYSFFKGNHHIEHLTARRSATATFRLRQRSQPAALSRAEAARHGGIAVAHRSNRSREPLQPPHGGQQYRGTARTHVESCHRSGAGFSCTLRSSMVSRPFRRYLTQSTARQIKSKSVWGSTNPGRRAQRFVLLHEVVINMGVGRAKGVDVWLAR